MKLTQLINSVNRRTSYSWDREDVIDAVNEAARRCYNWVVKEWPGHEFIKFDTSLTLAPNASEYLLQPDIEEILRVREQDPASLIWRTMNPVLTVEELSVLQASSNNPLLVGTEFDDNVSQFKYYGPYEKDDGKYYIQVQPQLDVNRPLEVMYSAQFVDIQVDSDYFMMPPETHGAIKDIAISEIKDDNDDDGGPRAEQRGFAKLGEYIQLLHVKNAPDHPPKQETYLD